MKTVGLFALTLLCSPLAAFAAIQADSSISTVTVYPDSARVTRIAKIALPAGENQVLLPNLPLSLDEASLRVSGESAESVALGSVQLEQAVSADAVQAREKQLHDEIDGWKRKRQEVLDAKTRAEQQIEFIRAAGGLGVAAPAEDGAPAPVPAANAAKTIAEFDKGIAQLESKLALSSVPRLDPRAVLTSKAVYTGEAPLIPGAVSLYRDGSFVGSSNLSPLQKGEAMKLAFGEDDRVKIKFNAVPEKTTEKGLLTTRENRERQYEVTVENHHDNDRSVVLYDTLPVSAHEDINITVSGEKPQQSDIDGKKGVVAWEREVGNGEKLTLKYGYTVSYPQGQDLSGL